MKKVRDTDARTLDHKTLTELRQRAIKAVQGGAAPKSVASALGVALTTVYDWLALYRNGGWGALDAKKRGGRKPRLNGKAMKWVFDTVTTKDPQQMKFPFMLWTIELITLTIQRKCGIKLSRWSVSRLLHQLGLSPQRPLWRAWQQDPKAVDQWLKEEYPRIKARAKRMGADIFFGDEAGVRSDHHAGTTWGVKGLTPVVRATGARFGLNMISALSPRGELRFMIVDGKIAADQFIEFLRRLTKDARRPIFLIVDGHSVHKAKKVSRFVESLEGALWLFSLPAYSPELNPDELVWNHLKNHSLGKQVAGSKEELKAMASKALRKMQRNPQLVRSFFHHPETAYAA
jgi:transposase